MAKIGLPKGSGKRLKVREKSGNFEMDIEWQPCLGEFGWSEYNRVKPSILEMRHTDSV